MNFASIVFQCVSFIYVIMIAVIFVLKRKVKNVDVTIYSLLLATNIISLCFDVASIYTLSHMDRFPIINKIVCRTYLCTLIIWIELLSDYFILTVTEKNGKYINNRLRFIIILITSCVLCFVLPMKYYCNDGNAYTYGIATNFVYLIYAICILSWLVLIMYMFIKIDRKTRENKTKKLLPIFVFVGIGFIAIAIQYYYPNVLLATSLEAMITILMFHTIENPDINVMKQLEEAKNAAEYASKAKSEFLSSMSHEIRTPLNAIIGFSEFIMDSESLPDAKNSAKDVISASQTLLETVNGILDISKVESGKLEIIEDNYNFKELIDSTIKMAKARLGEKQLVFNVHYQENIPESLYGDKASVNKVIINILTNAIKYTEKGSIDYTIEGVTNNGKCDLTIKVKDTGIGIKKEDQDKLFNRFQRLDEHKTSSIEGTGLGLAITKQLVTMMGGTVTVNSEYGKGSEFIIKLSQKISTTNVAVTQIEEEKESTYDFSSKKILVVDDNNLNLKLAGRLFNRYNCQIETAKSGYECIDLISKGVKYDIIFLDDVMPNMLGSETLQRLKKMEGFTTPVVSLTANAIDGVKEKYINLGFDEYLAKPIEKNKLEKILVKFLINNEQAKSIDREVVTSSTMVGVVDENVQRNILSSPSARDVVIKNESGDNMENNNNVVGIQTNVTANGIEITLPNNEVFTDYSNRRVLVVDDNKLNLKVALKFMDRYKFQTDEAYSGEECLNKIKSGEKYDIIFMDIMMPNMNGVETFHELQKVEGFNTPVVVALTADAVEGAKEKYLGEGFAEYISKPIVREHLDHVVHQILDNKE